jgi:hypothetical protein
MATLIVDNDIWCDVTIDGIGHARDLRKPIQVRAGRHTVHCQQGQTDRKWEEMVVLAPGETRTVRHEMLGGLAVTIGVDEAIIDGVPHRRGEVVQLKTGRHDLARPGVEGKFMTITTSCTVLVRGPDFDCYP